MSDVVNAELRHTIVEATNILFNLGQESGSGSRLTVRERECINDVRVRLEALSLALPGLQAEAPEDAEVAKVARRFALIDRSAEDWKRSWGADLYGMCETLLRARTPQAEAQAPTTAASVADDLAAARKLLAAESGGQEVIVRESDGVVFIRVDVAARTIVNVQKKGRLRDFDASKIDPANLRRFREITEAEAFGYKTGFEDATTAASVLTDVVQAAQRLIKEGLQLRGDPPRLVVIELADKSDPHYELCLALERYEASTVGAPAPAPTMPSRERIEATATRVWEIAKHQAPIEPGTDHERIVRVIEGLFAKGDTP